MNRSLLIPAICSLLAFAGLSAMLHGTLERNAAAEPPQPAAPTNRTSDPTMPPATDEAEQALTLLAEEYLRPWREWQNSPHRLYSRAAPRPVPSMAAKVELASTATNQHDPFRLATIIITTGEQSQSIPCVFNPITKEVRVFADGKWQTGPQWVEKAPRPWPAKVK